MSYHDEAIAFDCRGDTLVGILTVPDQPIGCSGVLVIVGGPQYRAGSHRQFVELSRALGKSGVPCMRFDYRGMGDSEGVQRDFTDIHDDITAAIDTFLQRCPDRSDIVLWGLCDGATAAAFSAARDQRITGLVMLNPWVHTEKIEARVYLKHYYFKRVASGKFWRKILSGEFDRRRSFGEIKSQIRAALQMNPRPQVTKADNHMSLPDRLAASFEAGSQNRLIILSEQDYVAKEFRMLTKSDAGWRDIFSETTVKIMKQADHTFSTPGSSEAVARLTVDWVKECEKKKS